MTATKAAEVLAAHGARWSGDNTIECMCGKRWIGGLQRERLATHARHQSEALAAAGLLADPGARTEPARTMWAVVLDDLGSEDWHATREQAEAIALGFEEPGEVMRVEWHTVTDWKEHYR